MSVCYATEQRIAYKLVYKAVQAGELKLPDACELCNDNDRNLCAHHWRGYAYPLDVWWICHRCNVLLAEKHDGSLTREQAHAVIALSGKTKAPHAPKRERKTREKNARPRLVGQLNPGVEGYGKIIQILVRVLDGCTDKDDPWIVACAATLPQEWDHLTERKQRFLIRAAQKQCKNG